MISISSGTLEMDVSGVLKGGDENLNGSSEKAEEENLDVEGVTGSVEVMDASEGF